MFKNSLLNIKQMNVSNLNVLERFDMLIAADTGVKNLEFGFLILFDGMLR